MAPPTNKPRLSGVDSHQVAVDVARTAIEHIISLHMQLVGMHMAPAMPEPEHTEIYRTVRALARYATRGVELDAPLHEYLISLIPLYSAALGEGTENVDGLVEREPDSDLGLVIAAAAARERLSLGLEPLMSAQVAVLAGVDINHVQLMSARGDVPGAYREDGARGKVWRYFGPEFCRWLSLRMVADDTIGSVDPLTQKVLGR